MNSVQTRSSRTFRQKQIPSSNNNEPPRFFSDYAMSVGTVNNFVLDGWTRILGSTEEEALSKSQRHFLELESDSTLFFGIADNPNQVGVYSDNVGGVSLLIERYE